MTAATSTTALTIAELIEQGRYQMANQLIGDIDSALSSEEVEAILDAIDERGSSEGSLGLNIGDIQLVHLAEFGLPYIVEVEELWSTSAFSAFLDEALRFVQPQGDESFEVGESYGEETHMLQGRAIYWPFRDSDNVQYVFDIAGYAMTDTTVEVVEGVTVLRSVEIVIGYDPGHQWAGFAWYKCDLAVRKSGKVERLGVPHIISSEWYGGVVKD